MNQELKHPLITKAEALLKIDLSYILKGGSWLTLGQIGSAFIAFLLSIAFARLIPKETYGEYKYILSITSVLGIFSLSGMGVAITRAVSAGYDGTILSVVRRALRWNSALLPVALVIAGYYVIAGNYPLAVSFAIFALVAPLITSFNLYDGFLVGKKDFKNSVIASACIAIIVALGLFAAMFASPSPTLLIFIYFSLTTLGTLYFYHRTISRYQPDANSVDPDTASYGTHLSIINVFNVIADQLDKVLVFHYLGAAQLAIYAFAIAIPEQIKGVLKNATVLMLPRFATRTDKELRATVFHKMGLYALVVGAIIIVYVISAPLIFHIFFPAYEESIHLSRLVACSLIAIIANVPYAAVQAKMKQRELYVFNISAAILQIALFFILTPIYGLTGTIYAIIGSRAYGLVFWLLLAFRLK